jgi:hypothetical protein
MPLYLDIHKNVEGLTSDAVIYAPRRDLEVQGKHVMDYLRYRYNEEPSVETDRCSGRH